MMLEDDNAVGMNIKAIQNTVVVLNEDNHSTTQTGGIMMKHSLNDDSKLEFNSHKQHIKHQCHENGTTIDSTLHQNAQLQVVKSFPNIESGGTVLTMVSNDNSKTSHNVRGLKASAKGKVVKRQLNHNSNQQTLLFETELSTINQELYEIIGNGNADFCFNNCQTKGNILAKKVSNFDIQNTSMEGRLHAIQLSLIHI